MEPSHIHNNNNTGKKPTYFCDHFKIVGHNISRCFKLHGYPNLNKYPPNEKYAASIHHEDHSDRAPDGTPLGLTPDQYTYLLSLLNKTNHVATDFSLPDSSADLAGPHSLISHISTAKWIIDSGSNDHICNDLFLFTNMNNISDANHKITTLDGTQHKVIKKGNIEISNGILLKDVLLCP